MNIPWLISLVAGIYGYEVVKFEAFNKVGWLLMQKKPPAKVTVGDSK